MSGAETLHAGCILVGEAGILIRGAAGSGKTTLARALVVRASDTGRFARLVSDDRTQVRAHHGRLLAQPVEPLRGLAEMRGIGIVREAFEPAAVVRLVVDLVADPERYPPQESRNLVLCGITIPRLACKAGTASPDNVLGVLSGVCDTVVTL